MNKSLRALSFCILLQLLPYGAIAKTQQDTDFLNTDSKVFYEIENSITLPKKKSTPDNILINKGKRLSKKIDIQKESTENNSINLNIHEINQDSMGPTIDSLIEQAFMAYNIGHIEVASRLYEKILKIDENNQEAMLGLAIILHQTNLRDKAKKYYTKIISKNPHNQIALNNFLTLVGEESPYKAIEELKKLEMINPNISVIPAQIAMIYYKLGNTNMAIKYINKAYLLAPDEVSYRYNMAILLDMSGDKGNAISFYKSLVEDYYNNKKLPGSIDVIKRRILYLSEK